MSKELEQQLEGDNVPVWLKDQMKHAQTTPVATPTLDQDVDLLKAEVR